MLHHVPGETTETRNNQAPTFEEAKYPQINALETEHEPRTSVQNFDTLLAAVKWQSSRHTGFSIAAAVLGALLAVLLIAAIGSYVTLCHLPGFKFIVDYSLTSAHVTSKSGGQQPELTVSGTLPLILMTGSVLFGALSRRERLKLTHSLAQYDDARAVGPLIEALFLRDRSVRAESIEALKRLLPLLKLENSGVITDVQRMLISSYFAQAARAPKHQDSQLTLGFLQALTVVGDGTQAEYVRRLAGMKTEDPDWVAVRAAAQQYLDHLNRRDLRQQEAETLLRAAEGVSNSPSNLLRSAEDTCSDPEELLRSSNSD